MKMCKAYASSLLASFILCVGAMAEYRVWTDREGRQVEAEYVRTIIDTVVLRREDGRQVEIDLDALSAKDREFAMLLNPPRMEIKVASRVDTKTIGYLGNRENTYRLKYQIVNPSVTVKKEGLEPYTASLLLELAVVGEVQETDRYIVLDRAAIPFSFAPANRNEFAFESEPIDLEQISGSIKAGIEYYGYVVQVRDSLGMVVAQKCNRNLLEQHADLILQYGIGSRFNEDMKPVRPRRPREGGGYTLPGRLF